MNDTHKIVHVQHRTKIYADNEYQFDRFTDIEKKISMKSFLADENIYEEKSAMLIMRGNIVTKWYNEYQIGGII